MENSTKVGVGILQENFTITEKMLAEFAEPEDAERYIIMKVDYLYDSNLIFFRERPGGKREFYSFDDSRFVSGKETNNLKVPAYEVRAEYIYDAGTDDEDIQIEGQLCMTYKRAKKAKAIFIEDGADSAEIYDTEINVSKHFWNTDSFFLTNNTKEVERGIM